MVLCWMLWMRVSQSVFVNSVNIYLVKERHVCQESTPLELLRVLSR